MKKILLNALSTFFTLIVFPVWGAYDYYNYMKNPNFLNLATLFVGITAILMMIPAWIISVILKKGYPKDS